MAKLKAQSAVVSSERVSWRPIATAPTKERKPIWLKGPWKEPQAAYSDTFWIGGFSVECKPTHWKPRAEPANEKLTQDARP